MTTHIYITEGTRVKQTIRVLIADSDSDFRLLLADRLKLEEDMEAVAMASDGEKALELCERLLPDVLIIDLVLPNLDGLAVIERLSDGGRGKPKIFVVSAFYTEALVSRCAELKVCFFMPKPCRIADLVVKLRRGAGMIHLTPLPSSCSCIIESEITGILRELGVPAHINGYKYLREAILLAVNDAGVLSSMTKELYPSVGKRFSTTPQRVERSIRGAIESAWDRGNVSILQSYFGYTVSDSRGKPTNSEFIALIADSLRLKHRRLQAES